MKQLFEIGVVCAGTMGNGIAHVFALFDFKVILVDINESILEMQKIFDPLPITITKDDKVIISQKLYYGDRGAINFQSLDTTSFTN